MTSIHERPALSPAQLVKKRIEEARAAAARDEWEQYEEENRKHLEYLRSRGPKPITHGTLTGYKRGCKCERCKRARADYAKEYRARHRIPKQEIPPKGRAGRVVKEWMHGTLTGYSYGCRCDDCKRALSESRPKSNTKHGTEYGYRKGCKCRSCVKAAREARARRGGWQSLNTRAKHGTSSRYSAGCRCSKCKQANTERVREYRARKRDAEISEQ